MKQNNQIISEKYYKLVQEQYKNNEQNSGYPYDIIHDINYLMKYNPKNCFVFTRKYPSTSVLEIEERINYSNPKIMNSMYNMMDYFLTNLSDYTVVYHVFEGFVKDYPIKEYKHQKEDLLLTMKFFFNQNIDSWINHLKGDYEVNDNKESEISYKKMIQVKESFNSRIDKELKALSDN